MTPDQIIKIIDLRCKTLGISHTELARLIGTSQPAISDYMTGKKRPGLKVLARMLDVLGMVIREPSELSESAKPFTADL